MRARYRFAEGGTTLLEVLVSVAITGVVLGTIGAASVRSLRNAQFEQAQAVGLSLGRRALEVLGQDIAAANEVQASGSGGATSPTRLTLRVPAYNSDSIMIGTWDTIEYWYNTADKTLHRSVVHEGHTAADGCLRPAAADQTMAHALGGLVFRYVALDTFEGDGSTTTLSLSGKPPAGASAKVIVNGINVTGLVTLNGNAGTVTLSSAPPRYALVEVWYPLDSTNPDNAVLFYKVRQVWVTATPALSVNGASVAPPARLTFTLRNRGMSSL